MNDRSLPEKTTSQSPAAGLLITVAFILSRYIFYLLGGRFIAKPIGFALQYLDPELLQHDLLQSLFYLHSQPPLFNLFIGLVLKISPNPQLTFALVFQTAGLLALLALYRLLVSMRVSTPVALLAVVLFMINPSFMLYENLLYYTYAEAVLILLAAFCLLQWCLKQHASWAALFWLLLCFLGGIRSVFHPVFFICLSAALGLFLYKKHSPGRQALFFCLASLVAIAPLVLVMVKNHAVYGFWGTSSWDGMNLWTKACGYGPEEVEELHRRGIISSLALEAELEPFRALEQYRDGPQLLQTPCHHPADCSPYKSTGKPNFNHAGYVPLSRQLRADSFSLIRDDPARFAFQTLASYSLTLWHSSDSVHGLFSDNMEILAPLEKIYRSVYFDFLGVRNRHSDARLWLRTGLITLLYLFVYAGALVRIYRAWGAQETAGAMVCLFCLFIHAYTIAVSSVIEFGENNRFRFPVDGVFLVLLAGNCRAFLPWLYRTKTSPCKKS